MKPPRPLRFAKPNPGLMPAERPRDKLGQFFELRRAFYHCQELMKELEQQQDRGLIAPILERATGRLALAAQDFAADSEED